MISFDEQLKREEAADEQAADRTLKLYNEALSAGQLDTLPRAKVLLARLFLDVASAVDALKVAITANAPRHSRSPWAKYLVQVPTDVLSVITIRRALTAGLLAAADQQQTFQRLAITYGKDVEREALLVDATVVSPLYVKQAFDNVKRSNTTAEQHIQRTADAVCRNILKLQEDSGLGDGELMQLGKLLLQITMDIDLLRVNHGTGRKGKTVFYTLNPEALEFLQIKNSDLVHLTDKSALTMLAPPLPWKSIYSGGYYSNRRRISFPLLRLSRQHVKQGIVEKYSTDAIPEVYQAVNKLQATPFELDPDVLHVVQRVWQAGGGVLNIPRLSLGEVPAFPLRSDWVKAEGTPEELEVFNTWKRACRKHYTAVGKNSSKVLAITGLLSRSREIAGRTLWFPAFLDWRNRIYFRGTPNPQGSEFERAVIRFARKRPLGERGIYWLKVHIANCMGYDKVHFDQRVQHVDKLWDVLVRDMQYPEDSDLYRAADDGLGVLAAVLELTRAYSTGQPENYCSGMIVHVDATCSGLQHFSALLRDPVGAKFTNLMNTGKREDIYQHLADLLTARVQAIKQGDNQQALYATIWDNLGITRALAKKPVMTYVYAATQRGVAEDILDYIADQGWHQDGVSREGLASFMAKLMFEEIEKVVPAAAACMKWLKKLASSNSKQGYVYWENPVGFTITQMYYKTEQMRVYVRSCGISSAVYYKDTDDLNPAKMGSAIAPNFIHSMDAAHLIKTVNNFSEDIVTIHDSFGAHACDIDHLLKVTKQQFYGMYSDPELLRKMFMHHIMAEESKSKKSNNKNTNSNIVINSIPSVGTYNISDVLESPFFFS